MVGSSHNDLLLWKILRGLHLLSDCGAAESIWYGSYGDDGDDGGDDDDHDRDALEIN